MAIDRAKLTKSAQKHLAKGNLDRAIGDYEKLVEDDPKDARTLLKLGDLYTKKGAVRLASDTYRKVAAQYAEQGFFLKAVAVFKQIIKLDPSQLDMWEKLAEMYELLSLSSEAVATYEQVAEAYQRGGKSYKALGPLGKIERLDPQNVAASIRYAEALSKARRVDDAVAAFERGANALKRQGRMDDYIKVAERLLYHQPDNLEFGRELAALYLERNDPKGALTKLQHCFKADPKAPDTLSLLARAFHALGQDGKTVSVYRELARIHAEAGNSDAQAEALRAILRVDANDVEARQELANLGGGLEPAASERPQEMAAIELDEEDDEDLIILDDEDDSGIVSLSDSGARALPTEDEASDTATQVARLMNEYEVFVRYGLQEKLESQLKTVLALMPSHLEARVKLAEFYASQERGSEAAEHLLLAAQGVREQDAELAMEYCTLAIQHDPLSDEAKQMLQGIASGEPLVESGVPAAPKTIPPVEDTFEDEFEAADEDDLIILDDEELDESDELPAPNEGLTGAPPSPSFGAPSMRAARGPATPAPAAPAWPLSPSAPLRPQGSAGATPFDRPTTPETPRPVPPGATPWPPMMNRSQRPAENMPTQPDPWPAQASDEGVQPGTEWPSERPRTDVPHPGTLRGQPPLGAPDELEPPGSFDPMEPEPDTDESAFPVSEPASAAQPSQQPSVAPPVEDEEDLPEELLEALEEIEFYAAQGMLDTARDTLADALSTFPGHPALLAKERSLIPPEALSHPPESGAPAAPSQAPRRATSAPPAEPDDHSFALAEKLAEEAPAEASNAGAEAIDVNDVIDQFRAGVRKAVDRDDSATHYDLGIAYMEMGLHTEAIEEFVLCLDSPERRCQTLTMIGLCYVAKGDMKPGLEHFEEALRSDPSAAEQLDLWFEMGNAYELSGRNNEALIYYEKVEEVDPEYREVSMRIARLGEPPTPEQEDDEFDTMFDNMILKD